MKENREEKYQLKDYSVLGISFCTINRIIVKRKVVSKNMIEKGLPISSLLLASLPNKINNNFEFWGNFNWDKFALKVISYSIIEAFYTTLIEILEIDDEYEILNGLHNERTRKYGVIPIKEDKQNFSWFELAIDKMARIKFEKSTMLTNSNLKEQIKSLLDSVLGKGREHSNPQKEFSRICVQNQSKNLEWISVKNEKENYYLSLGKKTKIEFEEEAREFRRQDLEKRISELNRLISKDYYIEWFYKILCEIIESDFLRRTYHS